MDPGARGVWTSATLTPLERPERQAGRELLTEEEAAEIERRSAENRAANDGKSAPGIGPGAGRGNMGGVRQGPSAERTLAAPAAVPFVTPCRCARAGPGPRAAAPAGACAGLRTEIAAW